MENNNLDYKIEWGILIHQLPKEFMGKAIRVLPSDIKHTFIDESGMRVYFCRKEICDEFIRKKFLDLDGILFNIFSTVTCLTIFGIAPVASKESIETYLQDKGMRVLDLYQIAERNHYRIVLDVPEVLANIELNPILLDASYGSGFPMEFYCRVCRTEGHKQYQCQQISTENHGEDGKRKRCAEANSSIKRNYKQGSKPSSSGVRNTIVQSQEIQSSSNSSTRENVASTVATPSTSSTPTEAESPTRRISNLTTRKSEDVRGRTRHLRSAKNSRMLKNKYPCVFIRKIIMDTNGNLPPERLLKFIKEVYQKKSIIEYAKKYTEDIPKLVQQIRRVISKYDENPKPGTAKQDIRIMNDLCNRLDSKFNKKSQ